MRVCKYFAWPPPLVSVPLSIDQVWQWCGNDLADRRQARRRAQCGGGTRSCWRWPWRLEARHCSWWPAHRGDDSTSAFNVGSTTYIIFYIVLRTFVRTPFHIERPEPPPTPENFEEIQVTWERIYTYLHTVHSTRISYTTTTNYYLMTPSSIWVIVIYLDNTIS